MAQVQVETAVAAELMEKALASCARMLGLGSGEAAAAAARE
jgi:hypothetical protein